MAWPDRKMGQSSKLPTDVSLYELNMKMEHGKTQFIYSRMGHKELKEGEDIEDFIAKVRGGDCSAWTGKLPGKPGKTNLSIDCCRFSYIVIFLSDDVKNWQFSGDRPPFTVGKDVPEHVEGAVTYGNATRVSDKGVVVADNKDDCDKGSEVCRAAYFIVNAKLLSEREASGEFCDPVNFHIDLVQDNENTPCLLPIIVDPDVGHPGGNNAGGGEP